jgi:hypothetical protein
LFVTEIPYPDPYPKVGGKGRKVAMNTESSENADFPCYNRSTELHFSGDMLNKIKLNKVK